MTPPLRVLAALALAVPLACRTGRAPYVAPSSEGAPALSSTAAARVLVLVVAESDPRVSPPWLDKAERAADAVAAALAQAGFRTARDGRGWAVRVTVSALLRGGDFGILVDAGGKALEELKVEGGGWGPGELAELGRAVRQRLERSEAVAALAGAAAPRKGEPSAAARGPVLAEPRLVPVGRRLAVLDFRGAAPPPVLAVLADQARAAAAEAGRRSGTTVLVREVVLAAAKEKGRGAEVCPDAACDLETARAAGADLAVTGEVTAIGEARILVLRLVDVASGALVASRTAQGKDDLALVEAARPAAAGLFE